MSMRCGNSSVTKNIWWLTVYEVKNEVPLPEYIEILKKPIFVQLCFGPF